MPFCPACGKEIPEGANFCPACGAPITGEPSKKQAKREQTYAGELVKCPNCGEPLDAFVTHCPSCGYEIRGTKTSSAVQEFADRMSKTSSEREKINTIRNFPIPNTKEDILEFSILASTNINENLNMDDEVSDAWLAKLGQAYQKAQLSFPEEAEFRRVEDLYQRVSEAVAREKKTHQMNLLFRILPNVIIVTGWLITVFLLIPFCQYGLPNRDTMQLLLAVDFIIGIFVIPRACQCISAVPGVLAGAGSVLSILALVLIRNNGGLLAVNVICSLYLFYKLYAKHPDTAQMEASSYLLAGICIAVCIIVHIVTRILVAVLH